MRVEDQRLLNEIETAARTFVKEKPDGTTDFITLLRVRQAMLIGAKLAIASDRRDLEEHNANR